MGQWKWARRGWPGKTPLYAAAEMEGSSSRLVTVEAERPRPANVGHMADTPDDWFDWPDRPAARVFFAVLRRRAKSWRVYDIGPADTAVYEEANPSRLIFMVDIVDRESGSVVGCPRVEFRSATVAGRWGSSHFCDEIDGTDDDSFSIDV